MFKEKAVEALRNSGLKITKPRLWIVEYLDGNKNHPTAIDIFQEVRREDKDFSFATVYNTLDILVKEGIVKQIKTEEKSCRYDPNTGLHGHFYCKSCGKLFDFDLKQSNILDETTSCGKVEDYEIKFFGICNSCIN
jgi:Fur family peroxide stress response transcriptional regulator